MPDEPTSSQAQRITAWFAAPTGVLALLILIPILGCCACCVLVPVINAFKGG